MNDVENERRRMDATIERLLRVTPPGAVGRPSPAPALRTFAVVAGVFATMLLVLVVLRRAPFFFVLLVLLLGLGGAWAWWRAGPRDDEGEAQREPWADDELRRTEASVLKLRQALAHAPSAVHTFAPDAERALDAISRGSRALARRADSLRRVVEGIGSGQIEREHADLLARLIRTSEPEAHRILEQAIVSSERKRHRVRELQGWAERVAAERLRIRHTLEATYLDVERAIAAELPPVEGEAAWSLGRLTDEMSAIAEALERHATLSRDPDPIEG